LIHHIDWLKNILPRLPE